MKLAESLKMTIASKKMLLHPFYRDWMEGKLSQPQLQRYATAYIPFVDTFPRFVSAVHSQCIDSADRKVLLENLNDEEGFTHSEPHPKLWRDFAIGIGADTKTLDGPGADLANNYMTLCQSTYEEGLAALFTYEHQIPEVAHAKIDGLSKCYGIYDTKTIQFFSIHETADIYHSKACEELINKIPKEKWDATISAATCASKSLWNFLTEMHKT